MSAQDQRRRPPKLGPSRSQAQTPQSKQDGSNDDLTTILNPEQLTEITVLLANITVSMRQLILDSFSATAALDPSFLPRDGLSEDEKLQLADPGSMDPEKLDRQRKLKSEIEKDLATTRMQYLKREALNAFDEWRQQVLLRVGKVVNSESTARQSLAQSLSQSSSTKPNQSNSNATETRPALPQRSQPPEDLSRSPTLKFKDIYPPVRTSLTKLPMEQRTLILHSILLLLLSLESYPAPSRILMLTLTSSLKLPLKTFEADEYATARGLLEHAKSLSAESERSAKEEATKSSRKWKVGLASVAGAAVIGITGGLAAPLVAAGVGSVMGGLGLGATAAAGYLGTIAGSSVVVGSLFGAYGGRMTGEMMDKYAREVSDFEFLAVHREKKDGEEGKQLEGKGKHGKEKEKEQVELATKRDHKLRVTICISGWLTSKEEVASPWVVLGPNSEVFALKYELEALLNLGNAMNGLATSAAWGYAQKELIQRTIFAELMAAMWPLGLLKVARVIDNPFSVAMARSEKAGAVLADALVNKAQGERPVTLVGYSLGARVIYACLRELARRGKFGLVENAVLMGAPTPSEAREWRILRSVVSGRLVNVYSQNDYVLGFMYRTSSVQYGIAGLQPVEGLKGVENVDVTEEVSSHPRYRYLVGSILRKVGFEDVDMEAVQEEEVALKKRDEEAEKNSLLNQRKRLLRRESTGGKEDEAQEAEQEADEIDKSVKEATEKTLVTRVVEWWYTPRTPKAVEDVKGKAQKVAEDPSQAGGVANQATKNATDGSKTYAQWAYDSLPSMPNVLSTGEQQPPTQSSQSYTSKAGSYLPSLPSRSKQQPEQTTTQKVTDGAKNAASNTVTPTVKNALAPQDNPAVKQLEEGVRKPPVIHQAASNVPGGAVVNNVTDAAGTTVTNALDTVGGVTKGAGDKGEQGIKSATDSAQNKTGQAKGQQKQQESNQSEGYLGKAGSYIPNVSMPSVGMPSLSGWGGGGGGEKRASAPKLEKRRSSQAPSQPQTPQPQEGRPQPPKLPERQPSTPAQKPVDSSGVKSPPPKLDRLPSGVKSPAALERQTSGLRSPPAKLDRLPSGVKSPPASGTPQRSMSNVTGQAQGLARRGSDQAKTMVGRSTAAAGQAGKSITGAVSGIGSGIGGRLGFGGGGKKD